MKNHVRSTYINLIIAISAVGLIGFTAIFAGWYYILKVSNDVNRLNTETETLTNEASTLSNLQIRLEKISPQQDIIYETIPTEKDVSSFLATFQALSAKHNIKINNEMVGDSKTNSTKTGSDFSQAINEQQYYLLQIHDDISGNYSDVQGLINDLAATRRLTSITDLVITADYSDATNPSKVRVNFVSNIYAKK
jgi:Tfp pilus assembly protein PilO